MNETGEDEHLRSTLTSVRGRLRVLTVAVILLTMMLVINTVTIWGSLVNYFGSDVMLVGWGTTGAALLGFGFGWFARRRA